MSEESQNQSSDPFPEGPADDPLAFDDSQPPAINRPASGARQVAPGEILSMDFQGSETAGDFLGLDTEFTEATIDPMAGGGDGLDLAQAPLSGQAADMDQLDAPAPLTEVMEPDGLDEGESYDSGYEDGEFDEYDEFGGEADDYAAEGEFYDEAFEDEEAVASSGGRAKVLIGSVVVLGLLAAGAVTLGPGLLPGGADDGTDVAVGPIQKTPITTGPDTAVVELDPVTIELDPLATDPGGTDPATDPTGGTETVEVPNIEDFITPDPGAGTDQIDLTDLLAGTGTEGPATDPLTDMTNQISQIFGMQPEGGQDSFPDFAQGFDWVSEDMLDMIWRGNEVPMEAIGAPARTLMPHVGQVMVHMTSGEVFEGRLYAVGQDTVWIDTEPGRVGLEGGAVERIALLGDLAVEAGSRPAPTGKRVRANVPGGWIYGRILAENGKVITLVSDDGAKVTLNDPEIQSLGSQRAIIIHR
jgi:hypothetical protein